MDEKHTCPRRNEIGQRMEEGKDWYSARGIGIGGGKMPTCSYCGSLNPDDVMAALEEGAWVLGPTDKSYKAYISETPSEEYVKERTAAIDARLEKLTSEHSKENHRLNELAMIHGPDVGKFYYQHLSVDQRKRFVELMNEDRIKWGYPGYPYTKPFFVA